MDKITCFLPCRQGSQRVPNKNTKLFAGFEFGLIQIKLKQLLASSRIEKIILSTNDSIILDYANSLRSPKIHLHRREEALSSSDTSTDALVHHAFDLILDGHILWTHVTSPFVTAVHYDLIIDEYFSQLERGYDSLMTVCRLQSFLWRSDEAVNYDRSIEKWPRTQTLNPLFEVNSAVFLAPANVYKTFGDRIGLRPFLFEMDRFVGFDIDWPEDFLIAESMVEKGITQV